LPKNKLQVKFSQVVGVVFFQLTSLAQAVPAQHSVQPTGGTAAFGGVRDLWALSTLEGNPALGVLSRPATSG